MSEMVRRHRLATVNMLLVVVLAIGAAVWFAHRAPPARATPAGTTQPAVVTLDRPTYQRVRRLRETLCLTAPDLAGYGCSADQTAGILSALVSWDATNNATRSQLDASKATAAAQLAAAARAISIGPSDPSQYTALTTAKQAVHDAAAAEAQLDAGAASVVQPLLSDTQQSLWTLVRANVSAPLEYRFVPNLTADQLKQLLAPTAGPRPENSVLSAGQQQARAAAETAKKANIKLILQAEAAVLALPSKPAHFSGAPVAK